jgi:hypothetical protein
MKSSTKKFSLAVLLALLCIAAPAFAAPSKKTENQRAAEIAMKAVRLYRAGQNAEAAKLFLEAYEISKRPAQLRNAAKAYEEGGMLDQSLELWTRYRDHEGVNKDEKAEADAHIQLIAEKKRNTEISKAAEAAQAAAEQARIAAEAAQSRAEEASKQATLVQETRIEPQDEGTNVGSLVMIGGGGAAAIAGGVFWFLSSSRLTKLDQKIADTNERGLIVGISPTELEDEVSGINTGRVLSGVLLTAGATAVVSGVVWLILDES